METFGWLSLTVICIHVFIFPWMFGISCIAAMINELQKAEVCREYYDVSNCQKVVRWEPVVKGK